MLRYINIDDNTERTIDPIDALVEEVTGDTEGTDAGFAFDCEVWGIENFDEVYDQVKEINKNGGTAYLYTCPYSEEINGQKLLVAYDSFEAARDARSNAADDI